MNKKLKLKVDLKFSLFFSFQNLNFLSFSPLFPLHIFTFTIITFFPSYFQTVEYKNHNKEKWKQPFFCTKHMKSEKKNINFSCFVYPPSWFSQTNHYYFDFIYSLLSFFSLLASIFIYLCLFFLYICIHPHIYTLNWCWQKNIQHKRKHKKKSNWERKIIKKTQFNQYENDFLFE